MSATRTLAQFIADTDFENLPPAVVEAAKIAILDGVANMAAGSVQELADIIGRYVRDAGGSPQASVVGWGYKTNPPAAAFANGVFGHCLDYEIQGFPAHPWHLIVSTVGPGAGGTPPHPGRACHHRLRIGLGNPGAVAGRLSAGHRPRVSPARPGGSHGRRGGLRQDPRP